MSLIDDYMQDSITITPKGTLQANGTYAQDGTDVSTTARVTNRSGVIRNVEGDETVYDHEIWMREKESVALNDTITFNSVVHEVIDIRDGRDIANEGHFFKVRVRVR